ncbi:TPA: hypothetical protein ACLGU7_004836 [Salmonella enterica]
MKTNMIKVMMGILCSVFLFYVGSVYADILTQGEKVTLDKMINQQVKNKNDRQSARNEWSEARRVAEFLCRPVALKEIQKRYPDADRVFLGSGHNDGLTLHSASHLTGCGQFRTGGGGTGAALILNARWILLTGMFCSSVILLTSKFVLILWHRDLL